MIKVNRYTRASKEWGKAIYCPWCAGMSKVYHFGWTALICQHCALEVKKNQWEYSPENIDKN